MKATMLTSKTLEKSPKLSSITRVTSPQKNLSSKEPTIPSTKTKKNPEIMPTSIIKKTKKDSVVNAEKDSLSGMFLQESNAPNEMKYRICNETINALLKRLTPDASTKGCFYTLHRKLKSYIDTEKLYTKPWIVTDEYYGIIRKYERELITLAYEIMCYIEQYKIIKCVSRNETEKVFCFENGTKVKCTSTVDEEASEEIAEWIQHTPEQQEGSCTCRKKGLIYHFLCANKYKPGNRIILGSDCILLFLPEEELKRVKEMKREAVLKAIVYKCDVCGFASKTKLKSCPQCARVQKQLEDTFVYTPQKESPESKARCLELTQKLQSLLRNCRRCEKLVLRDDDPSYKTYCKPCYLLEKGYKQCSYCHTGMIEGNSRYKKCYSCAKNIGIEKYYSPLTLEEAHELCYIPEICILCAGNTSSQCLLLVKGTDDSCGVFVCRDHPYENEVNIRLRCGNELVSQGLF